MRNKMTFPVEAEQYRERSIHITFETAEELEELVSVLNEASADKYVSLSVLHKDLLSLRDS